MTAQERFTTISELEILNEAYLSILDKWGRAEANYNKSVATGFPNEKYKLRAEKYNAQLDELQKAINTLEDAE